MVEEQWLKSKNPSEMVDFLFEGSRRLLGRSTSYSVSDRKLCLFMLFIERYHASQLPADNAKKYCILDKCNTYEDWLYGRATKEDVFQKRHPDQQIPKNWNMPDPIVDFYKWIDFYSWVNTYLPDEDRKEQLLSSCADAFRDVVGNPYQSSPTLWSQIGYYPADDVAPVSFQYPVVEWLTPFVINIAKAANNNRSPNTGQLELDHLLVLSDAMEEAGCPEQVPCRKSDHKLLIPNPLLTHLRDPNLSHVPGCWVLELLQGN